MGLLALLRKALMATPRRRVVEREVFRRAAERPMPREMRFPIPRPDQPAPPQTVVTGPCWVIDGDTIVIDRMHIRIAGIDAPELNHPFGRQAKWAMVKLCKGQVITARIKPEMSYERVVAQCFLPDGRDLAAELVKLGLALDWPKFSGGKYRALETADARRKLWRATLRQSGVSATNVMVPSPPPSQQMSPERWPSRPAPQQEGRLPILPEPMMRPVSAERPAFPARLWLVTGGLLVLLVGCNLTFNRGTNGIAAAGRQPPALERVAPTATMEVASTALNVRERPSGSSVVIAQLSGGTPIVVQSVSGSWIGIVLADGRSGWVFAKYVREIAR